MLHFHVLLKSRIDTIFCGALTPSECGSLYTVMWINLMYFKKYILPSIFYIWSTAWHCTVTCIALYTLRIIVYIVKQGPRGLNGDFHSVLKSSVNRSTRWGALPPIRTTKMTALIALSQCICNYICVPRLVNICQCICYYICVPRLMNFSQCICNYICVPVLATISIDGWIMQVHVAAQCLHREYFDVYCPICICICICICGKQVKFH